MAPNSARVNTSYDAMGRVISRTNPFQSGGTPGPVTTIQYDLANRAVITMLPGGDIVRSDYSGSVVTATDQVNRKIKRETDGLGRLIKVTEQDPAGASGVAATDNVSFLYDSDSQYGTSAPGQLMRVTMGGVQERYTYDGFGRVSSATESITPYSVPRSYTTSYEYNGGSQLSKLIYPSGKEINVGYDDKGRFRELPGILSGVTYNLAGQVTGLQMPHSNGGVSVSYGYDTNRMQLTTQTATKGATSLMNLTYGYQATAGQMGAGSMSGNASQLMSISGTINSTTESAAYTYDNVGRLATSNQTSNGASAQRRFAYDRWGNRSGVWDAVSGGNQIQTIALQQSGGAPTNRITSVTSGTTVNYTYDAAGNVTNDGAHTYTYDGENRVVSVDNGATATYKYDHQNRRVSKTIPGTSLTHYVWQGSQVIAEHDATTPLPPWWQPPYQVQSARVDYVYAGSRMVYSTQRTSSSPTAWTARYYLSDRLSTRLVLDCTGNVLGRQLTCRSGRTSEKAARRSVDMARLPPTSTLIRIAE